MNTINIPNYEQIEKDFLEGKSLRQLEKDYKISRKRLSTIFKREGYYTQKEYPKEVWNRAIELYRTKTYSITKIAEVLNIDRHLLSNYLVSQGEKENKKKTIIKNDETIEICNLYKDGQSISQIAKKYNRSTNYIVKILDNYNIIDHTRIYRKHYFNESIFSTIDTEEKAYWLGFLYADGSVGNANIISRNSIELTLKATDKNHLMHFIQFISNENSEIPMQFRIHEIDGKFYYSYRVIVNSKKMTNDLRKLGCFTSKSLTLKFPTAEQVPKHLIRHFIRGYFDGDGFNSINSENTLTFGVCGTYDFCYEYEKTLLELGIIKKISVHSYLNENVFYARHSGNIQARKFFNYLYTDSNVFLDRKYFKFYSVIYNQLPS